MRKVAAIIAHFDPANEVSAPFATLVRCVRSIAQASIIVSTSEISKHSALDDASIRTIVRPNIGYDFYSYRVGLTELPERDSYDTIILVNSSFLVVDDEKFIATLKQLVREVESTPVVGVTESTQIASHLQSYLLAISSRVTRTEWFDEWVAGITPQNSKLDVIKRYEVGLSRLLARHAIPHKALVTLSAREKAETALTTAISKFRTFPLPRAVASVLSGRFLHFNPSHVAARYIAEQCGIIKVELATKNPLKLDLSWQRLVTAANLKDEVGHFIKEYQTRESTRPKSDLLTFRSVSTVPARHATTSRVAVVAHAYYAELLPELKRTLMRIPEQFDLFITTPHEGDVASIIDSLCDVTPHVTVAVFENRGRDIGPFVTLLREGYFAHYEAVLKVHLKRSLYSGKGGEWRDLLFDELCGDAAVVQQSLDLLRSASVGIVGPHKNFLSHPRFWGANQRRVQQLRTALGSPTDTPLGFFAGSMFWFRPAALAQIQKLPHEFLYFDQEKGRLDGTLAHAYERFFVDLAHAAGFVATSRVLAGEEIAGREENLVNTVPVL